jgi:hypothetical protein
LSFFANVKYNFEVSSCGEPLQPLCWPIVHAARRREGGNSIFTSRTYISHSAHKQDWLSERRQRTTIWPKLVTATSQSLVFGLSAIEKPPDQIDQFPVLIDRKSQTRTARIIPAAAGD